MDRPWQLGQEWALLNLLVYNPVGFAKLMREAREEQAARFRWADDGGPEPESE